MSLVQRPTRSVLLSTIALLAALAFLASSFASPALSSAVQDPPAGGKEKPGGKEKKDGQEQRGPESKLEGIMNRIKAEVRRLGREIDGKNQSAAWKTVCALQRDVLDAKLESPAMTESKPEAERPGFVNAFHAQLSGLLKTTCDLESAVLAGKLDDASRIQKEIFGPMQKEGHRKFRND